MPASSNAGRSKIAPRAVRSKAANGKYSGRTETVLGILHTGRMCPRCVAVAWAAAVTSRISERGRAGTRAPHSGDALGVFCSAPARGRADAGSQVTCSSAGKLRRPGSHSSIAIVDNAGLALEVAVVHTAALIVASGRRRPEGPSTALSGSRCSRRFWVDLRRIWAGNSRLWARSPFGAQCEGGS